MVASSALTLLLLIGCAPSSEVLAPDLGEAPDGLKACTVETVPDLPGGTGTPLSKAQSAQAIGEQRTSAKAKDSCARDWQAYWDDVRARLAQNHDGGK